MMPSTPWLLPGRAGSTSRQACRSQAGSGTPTRRDHSPVRRNLRRCVLAGFLSACATSTATAADKSAHSLAHPTPREQLRELSTDRPDKTESPYTVDAGHFQFEMDVLSYATAHDDSGGGDLRTRALAIAPINVKVGLSANVDLQVVVDTYNRVRVTDRVANTVDRRSGFGDITTRLKINLWGNDGGKTAFAAMPFVKFPTNQHDLGNDSIEGGVILPLAVELSGGWGLGLMTEVDFLRNADDDGYDVSFINSITFSHDIAGKLGGYVEFITEISTADNSDWVGTLDLGLTYGLTDDVQLDAGINIGVTDAADDLNPFVGVSWRH